MSQWRAPEEYKDDPLNEAIDIWSLGNNFFALLTGYSPLVKNLENLSELKNKVMDGQTAFIDPRFHLRSYAESALADIIPLCWKLDPDERIDIFELTQLLRGHLFFEMTGIAWDDFVSANSLEGHLSLQQFMEYAFHRGRLPASVEENGEVLQAAHVFHQYHGLEHQSHGLE